MPALQSIDEKQMKQMKRNSVYINTKGKKKARIEAKGIKKRTL